MNEPVKPFIDHVPPVDFPPTSLVGVNVPADLNKVIIAAAAKSGICYEDQFLKWAQMGAECSRMHQPKMTRSGRKNRK